MSAKEKTAALNPEVSVQTYKIFPPPAAISKIIKGYDFVIDATDKYSSKSSSMISVLKEAYESLT